MQPADDLMEYLFFDYHIAQSFMQACEKLGLNPELDQGETPTDDSSYTIQIRQTMSDTEAEKLEVLYDEMLFGDQAAQIEGNDETGALADVCGVQVQLQSGKFTTVAIHPETMNKILSVLSVDELQQFLAQVAEDIENPKSGPICSRN